MTLGASNGLVEWMYFKERAMPGGKVLSVFQPREYLASVVAVEYVKGYILKII